MKKRIGFLLMFFVCFSATAQTDLIDSLKIRLEEKRLHDTVIVDVCTQLGNEFLRNSYLKEAKYYGEKAKKIATKIDYSKGILNGMNVLAQYYADMGEFKTSVKIFEEYIVLFFNI